MGKILAAVISTQVFTHSFYYWRSIGYVDNPIIVPCILSLVAIFFGTGALILETWDD